MNRIIFVGINNKPGLSALDSSTKTGRVVDDIVEGIENCSGCMSVRDLTAITAINGAANFAFKTNLYDLEYLPKPRTIDMDRAEAVKWKKRIDYSPGRDIVVALGLLVKEAFTLTAVSHIYLMHPAAIFTPRKREEYIKQAVSEINARIIFREVTG